MKSMLKFKTRIPWLSILFFFLAHILVIQGYADVKMPRIFSDNMVLQRDASVKVWGWADPGERVRVTIEKQSKSARADRNGNWSVLLDPLKAGGPVRLTIQGKNTIHFDDVLIGEVWLASGQSNMEWQVSRSANADEEISLANYPEIRLFTVPRRMSGVPLNDLEDGEWLVCNPENIGSFSAVAYFFGRHLQKELNVPIGLINSSWGGTVAETWISPETIAKNEDFADILSRAGDFNLEKLQEQAREKALAWAREIDKTDLGKQNNWEKTDLDDSNWAKMDLPVMWEQAGLPDVDGVVWFRREFTLTESQASQNMLLNLGPIDDSDVTYVNGNLVGQTMDQYNANRRYEVAAQHLKPGKNIISVRVIDTGGGGGFWGDASQMYYIAGTEKVSLAGIWRYALGVRSDGPPQISSGPNAFPSLLYNGMIKGINQFSIRGSIWYQGESNAGRAYQYRTLFPSLINDWRVQFNNPNMPFLFVQLANFMQADRNPVESQWAELREAQTMTLSLPFTGMASAIDIGDADDIHPTNKQDVGRRLALPALNMVYEKDLVYSGPIYKSMTVDGNKIRLSFTHSGSGLVIQDKYGYLKAFTIAGEDKVFHWAKAYIEGDQVVVYSEAVKNPVAVRYAWGNNPDDANLYNKEGLPANSFRTDDWPGITGGRR